MIQNLFKKKLHYLMFLFLLAGTVDVAQAQRDVVNGNLIQFNDNGLWCWYQDERAVVDIANGRLVIGSASSQTGIGNAPRNGADEVVFFDFQTQTSNRYVLNQWPGNCDDHNTAGFIIRPDRKYLAMYDQHYDNYVTRYRIYDGSTWATEQTYDWRTKPGGIDYTLAYNNVYYLSAEGRMYDFQRANHRAPNFLISTDLGNTWTWGGQLTTNSSNTYNKGYYKYWGNGVDRIDFIFTEQHPRDTSTSIYHGYIKGGKAYKSDGTLVDDNIFDTLYIPTFKEFTKVFGDSTIMGSTTMRRCWQTDVMRYSDNTIAAIITARSNDNTQGNDANINPDHNFIYCRDNGTGWSYSYLGKAGKKLYSSEADYTGLAALCPNDPNTLYISTPYSPIDTSISLGVREIWKGVTTNHGASWSWTPITQNSVRDNLRPIVPLWDTNNTALLWCRGTYGAAQSFDAAVVGVIDHKLETISKKTYADADPLNTTLANGSPLTYTGPDTGNGTSDGLWHIRTGRGNNGSVLASAELTSGENAPAIKTHVLVPFSGTYDVWVNFWGYPITSAHWRIKAGFLPTSMQLFRSMACKEVDSSEYNHAPIRSGSGNTFLYQAYLGRVQLSGNKTFNVFVDDSSYQIGSTTALRGDVNRTWYDGISYALVNGSITAAPIFTLSDTTINFGVVPIGAAKKDSVLISNPGTDTLQVTSISSTNARFTFVPATMKLTPSGNAYLVVTFTPQDTASLSGSITVTHNASATPVTIMMNAKGIRAPIFSLSTKTINFTSVTLSSMKKDSVFVSNSGSDTLRVTSVSSTNTRFTFSPDSIKLAPLGSRYLFVTFTPQDTSSQSGFIILIHNGLSSPDTLAVKGKGRGTDIVVDKTEAPTRFAIHQNYPNPFNPSTTISYEIPKASFVNLKIFNVLGQEVASLVDKEMPAGRYLVTWNAQAASSGIYLYKISAGNYSKTNKMILLK